MIALEEKDYDKAIAELQQTNQQNLMTFIACARLIRAKVTTQRRGVLPKAANFNSLPQLNHAFVRTKAAKMTA